MVSELPLIDDVDTCFDELPSQVSGSSEAGVSSRNIQKHNMSLEESFS